jgi:hypothetical protein
MSWKKNHRIALTDKFSIVAENFVVKDEVPVSEDEIRMLRMSLYIDDEIPMLKTYVKTYGRYKKNSIKSPSLFLFTDGL